MTFSEHFLSILLNKCIFVALLTLVLFLIPHFPVSVHLMMFLISE